MNVVCCSRDWSLRVNCYVTEPNQKTGCKAYTNDGATRKKVPISGILPVADKTTKVSFETFTRGLFLLLKYHEILSIHF